MLGALSARVLPGVGLGGHANTSFSLFATRGSTWAIAASKTSMTIFAQSTPGVGLGGFHLLGLKRTIITASYQQ